MCMNLQVCVHVHIHMPTEAGILSSEIFECIIQCAQRYHISQIIEDCCSWQVTSF